MSMDDMHPFHGLRGICATAIFLGHQVDMFLLPPFQGRKVLVGFEYLQAVSLFFLLSGIPLARMYSTTKKVHTWEGARDFWWKRFARLAPMYYLTLLLNLVICAVIIEKPDVRALATSFLGCAAFLQSWFPSLINVGGVLWQIAVFLFGYALFPLVSRRVAGWRLAALARGILGLWAFSAALFIAALALWPAGSAQMGLWVWHVHCVSRLPHVVAGVLLGEAVERLRGGPDHDADAWARRADLGSVVLLATALQAPVVEAYFGGAARVTVSIALEAVLLPVHAAWLAAIVLAHAARRPCRTRRALSLPGLVALGDASLAMYCLHLVVLFGYTMALAYAKTGDWRLVPTAEDWELRVRAGVWHAPLQWLLVVGVSVGASRWFEAPMRQRLAGLGRGRGAAVGPQGGRGLEGEMDAEQAGEGVAAALLPAGRPANPSNYGACVP